MRSYGDDVTFTTPAAPAPSLSAAAASAVTQTSATLGATINPNGAAVTECKFEYGTSTAYGASAPCAALPAARGSPVAVSASLSLLSANTAYHFRLVAGNEGGTSHGEDQSFKTLPIAPTVVTGAVSALASTSATLGASVDPNGGEVTQCSLEYGTSTGYGSVVSCGSLPGSGGSAVAVSAAITGLTAGTGYHYRIAATNAGGTSHGEDQSFKTLPIAPTVVTGAVSALASTSATLGASVDPNGGEVTQCSLEYGTSTGYGSVVSCGSLPGSGGSAVAVSAAITGLTAGTGYHYRIAATNAGGTSRGEDQSFQTPPAALIAPSGGTPEHQALPISPIPDASWFGLSLTATPAGLLRSRSAVRRPRRSAPGRSG